jgi:hypothetical protein
MKFGVWRSEGVFAAPAKSGVLEPLHGFWCIVSIGSRKAS